MLESDMFTHTFTCDSCGDYIQIDKDDQPWAEVLEELIENDWKWYKTKDGYYHHCGDCASSED
jgi:Fe2+ or Zn2+ uptake regulation protein